MQIIQKPEEIRKQLDALRREGKTVSFVPTMGALHEGHLRLVDEARKHGDVVLVSIFVNPTQFGPNEDFARYPRDLDRDAALLKPRGADLIYAPQVEDMYPAGACTTVTVSGLTTGLCGGFRPGHFDGVATVVTKLFNIAGPCTAVFGKKDYQQLAVIRQMTRDLNLPVRIVGMPTVREKDGLAMSSRNAYLTPSERERALCIARGLSSAHAAFSRGERSPSALEGIVHAEVSVAADSIDYISAVDPDSLAPLESTQHFFDRALIAVAIRIGKTRLIDNTVLGEDLPPISLEIQ